MLFPGRSLHDVPSLIYFEIYDDFDKATIEPVDNLKIISGQLCNKDLSLKPDCFFELPLYNFFQNGTTFRTYLAKYIR